MTSLSLLFGLASIGAALVVAVLALTGKAARSPPAGTLAPLDTFFAPAGAELPGSAAFEVRPLSPVLDRMRAIVAKFSPAGTMGKIQHRLDVAGNPGKWTPERVLAYKGLGLIGLGLFGLFIGARHGGMV